MCYLTGCVVSIICLHWFFILHLETSGIVCILCSTILRIVSFGTVAQAFSNTLGKWNCCCCLKWLCLGSEDLLIQLLVTPE